MLPVYLINLDRRPDRLAAMTAQLDAIGVRFQRVAAIDGAAAPPGRMHPRVPQEGHVIRVGRGLQALATTLIGLFERFLHTDAASGFVLEDDCSLSPDLARLVAGDDWVPEDTDLVQCEQFGDPEQPILLGPALGAAPTATPRRLHRMLSRRGGGACFWFSRRAACAFARGDWIVTAPSDHILFSPNVSPIFDRLRPAMLVPAIARQRTAELPSDLRSERAGRTTRESLRRGWTEINRAPCQLALTVTGRAKWTKVRFQP